MSKENYYNYEKSPYSGISFSSMAAEQQSKAYAHFVSLFAQAYERIYRIDREKIKSNNFAEKNIDVMTGLQLLNFAEDCQRFIKELNKLLNIGALKEQPLLLKTNDLEEKINIGCENMINNIDSVLNKESKEDEVLNFGIGD